MVHTCHGTPLILKVEVNEAKKLPKIILNSTFLERLIGENLHTECAERAWQHKASKWLFAYKRRMSASIMTEYF